MISNKPLANIWAISIPIVMMVNWRSLRVIFIVIVVDDSRITSIDGI